MLLSELLKNIDKISVFGNIEIDIKNIAYDSRKITEGTLFVCIKGFNTDGHKYIAEAIEKGAVAIIAEQDPGQIDCPYIIVRSTRVALAAVSVEYFENPSKRFKLIGITGTNGKTTTTYLIKSILESAGFKVGLIGTNQNMIGDKVLKAERTTPESFELQLLFKQMADELVDFVVMEVSSHSLELHRVDFSVFEVGVFTNITQDHLDFHATMENYLTAKSQLFDISKKGILNIDDAGGRVVYSNAKCEQFSYAVNMEADIMAKQIEMNEKGVSFLCVSKQFKMAMELGIPGLFSVYNALSAIATAISFGIQPEIIHEGLKIAKGVTGRAEVLFSNDRFTVIRDYAHTPDALLNIITTVRGYAKGRVVVLFGCGGDRDSKKRPIMGKTATELADFTIITSDNPRSENPADIINDIMGGVNHTGAEYVIIENRRSAIQYAIDNAKPNDIIILAGKGHETYQEINGVKNYFDEKEVVEEIIKVTW